MAGLSFNRLLLTTLALFGVCLGDGELLKAAFGSIKRESVAEATTVEQGTIPNWLDGTIIRQTCGSIGEVDSVGSGLKEQGVYNYIDHLFDCLGAGTNFKLQDGMATFTNRYWPTAVKKVYDDFDNKMNDSRVFFRGVMASFDYDRSIKLEPNVSAYITDMVPDSFPQVSFWQMGDRVAAWSEGTLGQWVDVRKVEGLGKFPFTGDNIFSGSFPVDNPAHEQYDENGDLWSMVGAYTPTGPNVGNTEWIIYKVNPDRSRTVMARPKIGDYDVSQCVGTDPYPNLDARFGYIHSFGMTENYVVLPMSSWLSDPCALFLHQTYPQKPFFRAVFTWYENHESSLVVVRKSDGQLMGTARTTSFFVTHMLNSYEEGNLIHMDMLVYKNSSIYEDSVTVDNIINGDIMDCTLERITIDTSDWSVARRSLRQRALDKMEMTNVNPNYVGKPYTYGYLIINPYMMGGKILKINVRTGAEVEYVLPHGQFPNEPIFVPRPGATEEDDGILLIQGIDAVNEIAFLDILDAKTMTREARVRAPEMAMFGIHNRYYPCTAGGSTDNDTTNCKAQIVTTPDTSAAVQMYSRMGALVVAVIMSAWLQLGA